MKAIRFAPLFLVLFCFSCKSRKNTFTPEQQESVTVQKLMKIFRNGEVNQCQWKNNRVFSCQMNVHDGGSEIFDLRGEKIASCYYNSNYMPQICEQLENCKTLFRSSPNIWGKPGVKWKFDVTADPPK